MNEIDQYLQVCGYQPDDLISLGTRAGAEGKIYFTTIKVSEAAKQIAARSSRNVWLSACPIREPSMPGSRGTADDVVRVTALWADLDVGEGKMPSFEACYELISQLSEAIDCDPVAIVLTGHGLQPRWRLSNDYLVQKHSAIYEVLPAWGQMVKWYALQLGGDVDNVYDLARILRAPGTTNIKPNLDPVAVQVRGLETPRGAVDNYVLEDVVATYAPETPPEAPKAENVDLSRGDLYTTKTVQYLTEELIAAQSWEKDHTDEKGRGWEKLCADAAYRLAELVKAEWNSLTYDEARTIFMEHAPTDLNWSKHDLDQKWTAQWRRAEPAVPPVEKQSIDPLADNYVMETSDVGGGDEGVSSEPPSGTNSAGGDPKWRPYTWDDRGLHDRVVALYGDVMRWSPHLKLWFKYSGGAWREDEDGGDHFVNQAMQRIPKLEAGFYDDIEEFKVGRRVTTQRKEFLNFVSQSDTASKHSSIARMIRSNGKHTAVLADFDAYPMLLNTPNGVIDTETGELMEHDPALLLRRQIPTLYDPDATCPEWQKFLERVMPDPEMRSYLQRIVGYTITGETGEQAIFVHHGETNNGKGVFFRTMEALLGEFSRVVPPTTLLAKRMESHPTDVAGMEGRRMLQVSEVQQGARLDEALIKRLSGEDTITARGMGQDFRDFRIVGKIHMATNHLPHVTGDPAVRRRLRLILWDVTIPPEERDKHLTRRLITNELPGILNWALEGTRAWLDQGLDAPLQSEHAVEQWIEEEDELGDFCAEKLQPASDGSTIPSTDLYIRYCQWSESLRQKPMSKVAFGRALKQKGFTSIHLRTGTAWKIRLRAMDPLASQ